MNLQNNRLIAKKPIFRNESFSSHKWKKDEEGRIDYWVWEVGFCNGPQCERCGRVTCIFCNPDFDKEPCEVKKYLCPGCGREVNQKVRFCSDCGQELDWSDMK